MTTPNQMATALLTEHLRFTPLTLLDDIINTVNELVFRAINAVEEGLSSASPGSLGFTLPAHSSSPRAGSAQIQAERLEERKTAEISTGTMQLESLLNATVDRDLDKFEIYTLRNILAVGREEEGLAAWVRLPHYRSVVGDTASTNPSQSNDAHDTTTPENIQLARRKVHETAKLNALLRAEEARNEAILAQLRNLGLQTSPTTQTFRENENDPNSTTAPLAFLLAPSSDSTALSHALASLPSLRALLASLKTSLHALPEQGTTSSTSRREGGNEDEGDGAGKRRRYLEGRTRRALERRGVVVEDLHATAAAGVGMGERRVGKEEVEGLEAVVRVLGHNSDRGGAMDVDR